ncbi:acid protease [Cylindrobasidium torrendii FP15055 ss-10]|uniref:Acid protease n=1 Tax=Cylindrobasidium torrendii FP15055 ss-10 TaxID=1314674 RepID=A0A0D7BXS0_9AGAR|nr:acid protease [Cylindrobasidium torrendii FP15055 ss-10]
MKLSDSRPQASGSRLPANNPLGHEIRRGNKVVTRREPITHYRRSPEAETEGKGVVLPLTTVGSSAFDATYTLPLRVGSNNQQIFVQIDSGSSDLWIASSTCSSSSCPTNGKAPLFDSSSSESFTPNGTPLTIQYLVGEADGTINWDRVKLNFGSDDDDTWAIGHQAFVLANHLVNEPLSEHFSGVLGMAPDGGSRISLQIPATSSDSPDGAAWTSNIFASSGLDPREEFVSIMLSRLDGGVLTPQAGSLMSIGTLPSEKWYPKFWTDDDHTLANITYTQPLSSMNEQGQNVGTVLWRIFVESLQVQDQDVALPLGTTVILDTGVPTILAPKAIANGIYGALNIGPGNDGNYYVPCSTSIKFNISLDMDQGGGSVSLPMHPLDMAERRGLGSNDCVGTVQSSDGLQKDEIVLGAAFLRNVEMILGYNAMVGLTGSGTGGSASGLKLGLRSLSGGEDAWEMAMAEWKQVRVDGKGLDGGIIDPGSGTANSNGGKIGGVPKVAVIALSVVGSLLGLCVILFGLWRCLSRRREKQMYYEQTQRGSPTAELFPGNERSSYFNQGKALPQEPPKSGIAGLFAGFFARSRDPDKTLTNSSYALKDMGPSEEEKRRERFDAYMSRQYGYRGSSMYSTGADTLVGYKSGMALGEFGENRHLSDQRQSGHETLVSRSSDPKLLSGDGLEDPWDPATALDWGGRGGERVALMSADGHEAPTRTA